MKKNVRVIIIVSIVLLILFALTNHLNIVGHIREMHGG